MEKITNPEERMSAALGAFIFFLPAFGKIKTDFVTFYMRQNFAIFLLNIVVTIISKLLILIIGKIAIILGLIVSVVILVLSILIIYKAYKGERFEIPYLYKYVNILISKVDILQKFFSPNK